MKLVGAPHAAHRVALDDESLAVERARFLGYLAGERAEVAGIEAKRQRLPGMDAVRVEQVANHPVDALDVAFDPGR